MSSDLGNYRPDDPGSSSNKLKWIDFKTQRARNWEIVKRIRLGEFADKIPMLLDNATGLYIPTRLLIGQVCDLLEPPDQKVQEGRENPKRRRGSDLMKARLTKKGKWSPAVHFDLLEPILDCRGKALEFEGSEQLKLTPKGLVWEKYPHLCVWEWSETPPKGVVVEGFDFSDP